MDKQPLRWVMKGLLQFARFAAVGVCNTAIDFGVTNLLVILLHHPKNSLTLMVISVTACGIATLNSFFMNRLWTFRDASGHPTPGALGKFYVVSAISLVVNTSTFLFFVKYLTGRLEMPNLLAINIAKLFGVVTAFVVAFLGYRLGVFKTESVRLFRQEFQFPNVPGTPFLKQAVTLVAVAAAVRTAYLLLTTAVYGDAVGFASAARAIAAGFSQAHGPGVANPFSVWQSLFVLAGAHPVTVSVLASWIPGVLLVIPVAALARLLYGTSAAWLAGLFYALQPRLVEFSGNGYPDMFYLLGFSTGIFFLTSLVQRGGTLTAAGWGASFALAAMMRGEALIAFIVSWPLIVVAAARPQNPPLAEGGKWTRILLSIGTGILVFTLLVGCWFRFGPADPAPVAQPGFGAFWNTLFLTHPTGPVLPRPLAAGMSETPAPPASVGAPAKAPGPFGCYLKNVMYAVERMPGVLLTPVPLFALILLVLLGRSNLFKLERLPLLIMLLLPLLVYPWSEVEPRLLFPILIPIQVFGAAGLLAFTSYASKESGLPALRGMLTAVILVFSLGVAAWRGMEVERAYHFNRQLAVWMETHIGRDELIAGCGNGLVATTAFLSGHRSTVLPELRRGEQLRQAADELGSRWLILYEPFLRSTNPALRPVLDAGAAGFSRMFEIRDSHGQRVQVLKRTW